MFICFLVPIYYEQMTMYIVTTIVSLRRVKLLLENLMWVIFYTFSKIIKKILIFLICDDVLAENLLGNYFISLDYRKIFFSSDSRKLCHMSCPGLEGVPPSLHCHICMCLFHPKCVGLVREIRGSYTCPVCILNLSFYLCCLYWSRHNTTNIVTKNETVINRIFIFSSL